jgi:SAM-dependent methyltransferase
MLDCHLDPDTALASRPPGAIDRSVGWLNGQLGLEGKRLCDLGCGPGLYAERFAAAGAEVTAVDFSAHSLDHARANSRDGVCYVEADYLVDELPVGFDVVTLIYYDLCALSPAQRRALLGRIRHMLHPGGRLVLDVLGSGALAGKADAVELEFRLMDGFWAAGDYVGIHRSLVYREQQVTLDHYLIVEPQETWQIFNWLQFYAPDGIEKELNTSGFDVEILVGDLAGGALLPDGEAIGVIAIRK